MVLTRGLGRRKSREKGPMVTIMLFKCGGLGQKVARAHNARKVQKNCDGFERRTSIENVL